MAIPTARKADSSCGQQHLGSGIKQHKTLDKTPQAMHEVNKLMSGS